jgi:rare lipoprotein A
LHLRLRVRYRRYSPRFSQRIAAHLSLPFSTVVTVTNLDNGQSIAVVINDRGPYGIADRIVDLCSPAFAQIAPLAQGVARVKITW